jgi:hypothetical protein
MKIILLATSAAFVNANISGGLCLDSSLAVKLDIKQLLGQWYEIYREKDSLIEKDGKCNSNFIQLLRPEDTIVTDKNLSFPAEFTPVLRITNT